MREVLAASEQMKDVVKQMKVKDTKEQDKKFEMDCGRTGAGSSIPGPPMRPNGP